MQHVPYLWDRRMLLLGNLLLGLVCYTWHLGKCSSRTCFGNREKGGWALKGSLPVDPTLAMKWVARPHVTISGELPDFGLGGRYTRGGLPAGWTRHHLWAPFLT